MLGLLFQIDDFLPFAADIGRMQQEGAGVEEQRDADRQRDTAGSTVRMSIRRNEPCVGQLHPDDHAQERQRQDEQVRDDERGAGALKVALQATLIMPNVSTDRINPRYAASTS